MSDIMLHGVLRMPPELWGNDEMDVMQRHSRCLEASDRIYSDEKKILELEEQVQILKDALRKSPVPIYNAGSHHVFRQ